MENKTTSSWSNLNSMYYSPPQPIIVVDVNYLSSEDKLDLDNYKLSFEGYIVVFIDSSKSNTQQSAGSNNPPIYKL